MCRKYSPTTELPSLKLTFLHLNKKWWKMRGSGFLLGLSRPIFRWKNCGFFGGVSGGFKYFPFSPLEKINPASVKNHLGPMRIAIYEEHIAIFYSVAYCPTKTPQYTHGKNIFVLYILCHSWTGEQDNNGVFSQPRVHISSFFSKVFCRKKTTPGTGRTV